MKRKSEKKEDAYARNRKKIAKHYVFPMIWGSGGSKSRLAKAAGAEPSGQMRDEKLHAMLARSTFPNQNVQNTPHSEHLWKLRCRKIARRCGAKHISKSKMCETSQRWTPFGKYDVEKVHAIVAQSKAHFQFIIHKTHHSRTTFGNFDVQKVFVVVAQMHILKSKIFKINGFGSLLQVQMSKKYMPLWREAHFQIKMLKTPGFRTNFGGSNVASLHYTTLHYTTLQYITLHSTQLHYTPLH